MTGEPTVERWEGAREIIFSVPYSDVKILTIIDVDGMRGAIYNPYKLTKPMPWLDLCPHCKRGEQKHVPLKIRKLIQILCSNKPDGPDGYRFILPNRYRLGARLTPKGWGIRIRKPESGATLHVVKLAGAEPIGLKESARDFRSPILLRTLKMLFSVRRATEEEVRAILSAFRKQQANTTDLTLKSPCYLSLIHLSLHNMD